MHLLFTKDLSSFSFQLLKLAVAFAGSHEVFYSAIPSHTSLASGYTAACTKMQTHSP